MTVMYYSLELRNEYRKIKNKNRIIEKIEVAASQNKTSISVNSMLSEKFISELERKGYSVVTLHFDGRIHTNISW